MMALALQTQTQGYWTLVRFLGAVDDKRVLALRVRLLRVVEHHPRVAADLSGCRVTGTRWMSVLLDVGERARACGHTFAVISPRPHAVRLCLPVLARGGRLLLCESAEQLPNRG
ncbi:STAS domain-containing protein [Nonomuraea sp. NPDC050783]|uniref:STAS domain-containing protein n=1 Tax=Nonomuraea sp. NPDC050783 TaxID=3154634 RepID=UPI0034664CD5